MFTVLESGVGEAETRLRLPSFNLGQVGMLNFYFPLRYYRIVNLERRMAKRPVEQYSASLIVALMCGEAVAVAVLLLGSIPPPLLPGKTMPNMLFTLREAPGPTSKL